MWQLIIFKTFQKFNFWILSWFLQLPPVTGLGLVRPRTDRYIDMPSSLWECLTVVFKVSSALADGYSVIKNGTRKYNSYIIMTILSRFYGWIDLRVEKSWIPVLPLPPKWHVNPGGKCRWEEWCHLFFEGMSNFLCLTSHAFKRLE